MCDSEKIQNAVEAEKNLLDSGSEFEEDFAVITGKVKKKKCVRGDENDSALKDDSDESSNDDSDDGKSSEVSDSVESGDESDYDEPFPKKSKGIKKITEGIKKSNDECLNSEEYDLSEEFDEEEEIDDEDDVDCDYDDNDIQIDEGSEHDSDVDNEVCVQSSNKRTKESNFHEDIYGRKRDKLGNVIQVS